MHPIEIDAKINGPPNNAWTSPVTSGATPATAGQDFNTRAKTVKFT